MKKGDRVVCKNCGTEYVWGKKRKLSGGQRCFAAFFYIFAFVMLFLAECYAVYFFNPPRLFPWFFDGISSFFGVVMILFLIWYSLFVNQKNGLSCPKCNSYKCIPSDTPIAKEIKNKK